MRVVVAEPLDAAEQGEWVGVVRSALRIPDGRLALCGGIAYVLEEGGWAEEYVRVVEVPAGDYRATLYCYPSAPNGRLCVERSGSDEPLGAWFRRTRSGQAMPTWLHNLCVNAPSLDPAHGKQWRRAREKLGGYVIDFLLHLETADGPLLSAPVAAEGVMDAGECRKPDPFPLGIPTVGLEGAEEEDDDELPPAEDTANAAAQADTGELIPIAGGPVDVPIANLTRVAQIAWMCHPYTHPGLRITFPGKPPRLGLDDVEDAKLVVAGNEARIGFANSGQPADALVPLTAVARQLAGIPDAAVVEFFSSRLKTKSALGAHRYRGTVRHGIWRIEARVTRALADYFGGNSLQRTGAELALRRRDPALLAHVVARVFWSRYAETWPLQDEDTHH